MNSKDSHVWPSKPASREDGRNRAGYSHGYRRARIRAQGDPSYIHEINGIWISGIFEPCASMYEYRIIPIFGKKRYSCHNCCNICGVRDHGIYYDRSVYIEKSCTCPKTVSYRSACVRSNCPFQCDMDG